MTRFIQRRQWLALGAALPLLSRSWAAGADSTIVLGQSAPISGPGQHFGIEYARGLKLFFDATNAKGGLNGRRIDLITYDDQYEAETAALNTQDLITTDKAFALIGYVGSEMSLRSLALPSAAGVPFIAPLTGAEALRAPNLRNVVNFRASHNQEVVALVRQLSTVSVRRVAVLVQTDADGNGLLAALQPSLTASDISLVGQAGLERNSTGNVELGMRDVKAAVAQLLAKRPDAIIALTAHATTSQAIREARGAGFKGSFYATSLGSAAALAQSLGKLAAGVVVTQVVPSPTDLGRPVVADYLAAIGTTPPDHTSMEGWLVAAMTVEALRRCGANLTRARFLDALRNLGTFDLGGFKLNMQPERRQASSYVDLTILDDRGRLRR